MEGATSPTRKGGVLSSEAGSVGIPPYRAGLIRLLPLTLFPSESLAPSPTLPRSTGRGGWKHSPSASATRLRPAPPWTVVLQRGLPLPHHAVARRAVHTVLSATLLGTLLAGCNGLPAGNVAALRSPASLRSVAGPSATTRSSPAGTVVLLRGWRDLWSDGIDQLAADLRARGLDAAEFKQSQSADVGDALLARAATEAHAAPDAGSAAGDPSPRPAPLVLIGFSYGADDSIRNAARLAAAGRAVDLLVLIDPVTPPLVPANVRRCVNFYQSNGAWDALPWLRGVPVEAGPAGAGADAGTGATADRGRVTNVDLRDRPDLLEPGTSHKTMAANPKLHAAILAEVERAVGQRVRGDEGK
ncbi:MAG: hypothetical protein JWO31_2910 [Phycisphaerales bacterium]|nr:hypothetical protein [Phycisphaerales bacterium]